MIIPEQPAPKPGEGDCWLDVIASMQQRRLHGLAKYGEPVHPVNGRDSLRDLGEELLDGMVYLRQLQAELAVLGNQMRTLKRLAAISEQSRETEATFPGKVALIVDKWLSDFPFLQEVLP